MAEAFDVLGVANDILETVVTCHLSLEFYEHCTMLEASKRLKSSRRSKLCGASRLAMCLVEVDFYVFMSGRFFHVVRF